MTDHDPQQLAERYLHALEQFVDAVASVGADRVDRRPEPAAWSVREVAFHAAEADSALGIRLRRIVCEDDPPLPGIHFASWLKGIPREKLDLRLAIDLLEASGALHVALIERLTPQALRRKGLHSEGHAVTAGDLVVHMAQHLESHTKQVARILASGQKPRR
jgi:hypothetical protein